MTSGAGLEQTEPPKLIAALRYDEEPVVKMLATLLAVPYDRQLDTLAVVIRAFILKREGRP